MKKTIYTLMAVSLLLLNMPLLNTTSVSANADVDVCYELGEVQDGDQYASVVIASNQGLQYNNSPVNSLRSVPEQGLALELGRNVSNFFSLGFGGWIVVMFDYPVFNGTGVDLKITEDTWGGSYPLEEANVYVSQDGSNWTLLGVADNTNLNIIHTTSEFSLPDGMEWINYVKIQDISERSLFAGRSTADGYDLNAVEALYSGVPVPCDFEYVCGEGFLYLDANNSSTESDLYLVDTATGNATYKHTYSGDFRNTLAADSVGNVYSIDRTTKKIMQLMPDGTTLEIAQTNLPRSEGTLTIAPDNTMYIALNNESLYSIDMGTGISTWLVDLTSNGVNVNGGDIAVNDENVMTIINTSGAVWTVDLGNGYAVASLGNIGTSRITGMTVVDDIYYATNDTNDKIYSFTHAIPTAALVGAFGYNFGSGDAASCAPARKDAGIMVKKSAEGYVNDPFEVNAGEEVTYTYAVTNSGELPLVLVEVEDDVCGSAAYMSGDTNSNDKLDLNEIWMFECTQTMKVSGSVVNTGIATANDPFGDEVSDEDSFDTTVKAWGCTLTQGYWKTHGDPGNTKKYDNTWEEYEDWYEILWTAPKGGNAYYILAHQYIAALLNSENAYVPSDVQDALDQAGELLDSYSDTKEILKKPKEDRMLAIKLAGILGNYNEGNTEVHHCSDMSLLETLEVPATSNIGIDSTNIFELGKLYLIKVSGTYRFANWGEYGIADAEWSYRTYPYLPENTSPGWIKGEGYFQSECGLDLQVNGCVDWGNYNPSNEYETLILGNGTLAHFWIYDNAYGDNSGYLTVEIYEIN